MAIKIGDAVSMSNPEDEQITPDDRQQLIEVIGGVAVQDYGHVSDGDKWSCSLYFSPENWEKILNYWNNRTLVDVVDAGGDTFKARIVIKSYSRVPKFPRYRKSTIEFWRV